MRRGLAVLALTLLAFAGCGPSTPVPSAAPIRGTPSRTVRPSAVATEMPGTRAAGTPSEIPRDISGPTWTVRADPALGLTSRSIVEVDLAGDLVLVENSLASGVGSRVEALNLATGAERWLITLPTEYRDEVAGPISTGPVIWYGFVEGAIAFDRRSGRIAARVPEAQTNDGAIAAVGADNLLLYVLGSVEEVTPDGTVLWRQAVPLGSHPHLAIDPASHTYVFDSGGSIAVGPLGPGRSTRVPLPDETDLADIGAGRAVTFGGEVALVDLSDPRQPRELQPGLGFSDTVFLEAGAVVDIGPSSLTAWDATTGRRLWSRPGSFEDYNTGLHEQAAVIIVDSDEGVLALDVRTGIPRWKAPNCQSSWPSLGYPNWNTDAYTTLLTCGRLEARDLGSGAVLWSIPDTFRASDLVSDESEVVSDGHLVRVAQGVVTSWTA